MSSPIPRRPPLSGPGGRGRCPPLFHRGRKRGGSPAPGSSVTRFLTFCLKVLLPVFSLMQFDTTILNILSVFFFIIRDNIGVAGRFKVNFGQFLTVFVIMCEVQPPRCSSHPIRASTADSLHFNVSNIFCSE